MAPSRAMKSLPRRALPALLCLPLALGLALTACAGSATNTAPAGSRPADGSSGAGTAPGSASATQSAATVSPPTPVPTTTQPPACPAVGSTGFDCAFRVRIAAVQAYLKTRPGTVGIILRDRQTGAVWRNSYATTPVWTASTIKLAMTVDLFTRERQGLIRLTADDRSLIQKMLHSSDDDAADTLWFRYAGADHLTYNDRFPAYGMTSLQPQKGFTNFYPYWGFQKCTPADLDRLITYVLTRLDATDRAYIVDQLQHVAPDQQWGVWGAGPAAHPGNKDGWSLEQGGWVINSVGFVGPGQRYTLAMMNSLNGHGGYGAGRTTVTHVAQLLFAGQF